MSDLISRQAAIDLLKQMRKDGDMVPWEGKDVFARIRKLPSVQPQWIPVTERLPEKAGKYLVTVKNGNVYAGTFDLYSGRFQCAATAWQPLPAPYQEGAADERPKDC